MNTTVTPHIGFYEVSTVDQWGIQVHQVGKDKRCTCGGTGKHLCRHIKAIIAYIKAGGERAPERRPMLKVRESAPPTVVPVTCPICDAPVVPERRGRWHCPRSTAHYFEWRGEHGVRQFLTQPHPNKISPFHQMTDQERTSFLETANELMRVGGYSPCN